MWQPAALLYTREGIVVSEVYTTSCKGTIDVWVLQCLHCLLESRMRCGDCDGSIYGRARMASTMVRSPLLPSHFSGQSQEGSNVSPDFPWN